MTSWIFLRHGESIANAEDWLSGHQDCPLTERGRAQADEAGRALAAWPLARAVSSDLQRARETAERALRQWSLLRGEPAPPLEILPALRERSTGDWTGRDRGELRAQGLLVRLTGWQDGPPGGESQQALARRILPAMAALEREAPDGPTLVVAHGGVMRVLLGLLDGADKDALGFFGVPNASPVLRQTSADAFAGIGRDLELQLV